MKAKNYEEALEIAKKYACEAESVLKSYWVIPFEEMETDKHWIFNVDKHCLSIYVEKDIYTQEQKNILYETDNVLSSAWCVESMDGEILFVFDHNPSIEELKNISELLGVDDCDCTIKECRFLKKAM